MAVFKPNEKVEQAEETVQVEFPRGQGLKVGANVFQLVVVDDAGQESEPDTIEIILLHDEKPTAVLQALDVQGATMRIPQIRAGDKFFLTGRKSTDKDPGKIEKYRFTWLA